MTEKEMEQLADVISERFMAKFNSHVLVPVLVGAALPWVAIFLYEVFS